MPGGSPAVPAGATGIGSMPGVSVAEATAVVAGELVELPHLVELPARGAGADLIGRTGALLAAVSSDLALETVPTGWRRGGLVTRETRRAASWLGEDLDRAQEVFGDSAGSFKVQVCGPWTWMAGVESGAGQPLLRDEGFRGDLADAWREAAAQHLRDVGARLPGRYLVLQVDEPMLPAVLDGRISTASGFGSLAAVGEPEAAQLLRRATESLAAPVVLHCCDVFPFGVVAAARVHGISWDCAPRPADSADPTLAGDPADHVAAAYEAGVRIVLGAVPASGPIDVPACWSRVQELWRRTGLAPDALSDLGVSPACGLAGGTLPSARAALAAAVELRRRCASDS